MTSRLVGTVVAALVVAAPAVGVAVAPAVAAPCTEAGGVSIVVDYRELGGGVQSVCDPAGGGRSAAALLTDRGFPLVYVQRQPGFVCRISGVPAGDPCVSTPPADAYWGLYWSNGTSGTWAYSTLGATSLEVPAGGSVGFAWQGAQQGPPAVAPPALGGTATPPTRSPTRSPSPTATPTRTPTQTPTTASATPRQSPTATVQPTPAPSSPRASQPAPTQPATSQPVPSQPAQTTATPARSATDTPAAAPTATSGGAGTAAAPSASRSRSPGPPSAEPSATEESATTSAIGEPSDDPTQRDVAAVEPPDSNPANTVPLPLVVAALALVGAVVAGGVLVRRRRAA